MAYEVTATRKRPQVFEKLVGQEFVVSTIENAIESGRIAHAYLFSGPRGVGKTTSARLLAKALNCEHGPTAHPCGECISCREITSGSCVDVIEIDGASNTSVNDIRVIKDEVLFPPQSSRYKIYIIDEVHMLSNSAFNALLKTIEEPPEYIIFIFATTELQKVPATIRSRCQQFHFQLISLENIKACLKEACDEMGIVADDDALFWIAKEGAGSMRDAYTLFDQVAAFSGNHITLEGIRGKLGIVGLEQIQRIVESAISGDRKTAILELSEVLAKGSSVEQCIRDFTDFFRNLLLAKENIDSEELLSIRREDIPQDILNALSGEQIEAALRYLLQCYREVRYSLSPRFELELFVSRLSALPNLTSEEELVKKLQELGESIAQGKAQVVKETRTVQVQVASPAPKPKAVAEEKPTPEQKRVKEKVEKTKEEESRPFETATSLKEVAEVKEKEKETASSPSPQPVDYNPKLPLIKKAAESSEIFGLASFFEPIFRIDMKADVMNLVTSSAFSQQGLNGNLETVRQIVRSATDFAGSIKVVLEEKQEEEKQTNPLLDKIAKAFRGTIVIENNREK